MLVAFTCARSLRGVVGWVTLTPQPLASVTHSATARPVALARVGRFPGTRGLSPSAMPGRPAAYVPDPTAAPLPANANVTPVSSSETSHSRRAVSGSRAARVGVTTFGLPRIS